MLSWWSQLRLLLWKGIAIKRRQKVWLSLEVLVPVVLFAIIALIRLKDFNDYQPLCHYSSRPFPSAGLLPFANGILCSIMNPCHDSPTTGDERMKIGVNQTESLIIQGIRAVLAQIDVIGQDTDGFTKELTRIAEILHDLSTGNTTLSGESNVRHLFPYLPSAKVQRIAVEEMAGHPLFSFLLHLASLTETELVSAITCGQNFDPNQPTSLPSGSKYIRTTFDDLKDEVIKFIQTVQPGPSSHHDLNCSIVPPIEDSSCPLLRSGLLSQFQSMMQGKILVSPSSPLTERLVDRLNAPLRDVSFLFSLLPLYSSSIALPLQQALSTSDLPRALKKLYTLLAPHVDSSYLKWLKSLEHLFSGPDDPSSLGRLTQGWAKSAEDLSSCFLADRFVLVEDESSLEELSLCLQSSGQFFSALVFPSLSSNSSVWPSFVDYSIRHREGTVDGTKSEADGWNTGRSRDLPFIDLKYITYGFSFLQEAVDKAIRGMQSNVSVNVGVISQQEPFPCTASDESYKLNSFLGLFVILSFVIPSALLVKNIVHEKETRLKELMRIMGLGDSVHSVSWAAISLVLNTISVLIISLLLAYARILPRADFTLIFVFLFLFVASVIAQSLFLSTFFSSANVATACTAVIFFLCMFPFQLTSKSGSHVATLITMVLPQTALNYGMSMMGRGDSEGYTRWATIGELENPNYSVHMKEVLIALSIDIVIYWILAWYISAIHTGVHGVSQPWYFPILKRYWFPDSHTVDDYEDTSHPREEDSPDLERDSSTSPPTVSIDGLSKVYSNGMRAVDSLHLRLYESQITGLLGHNGAGKTTTMSLLCGLFSPSSGRVSIYGRDLRGELRAVRDSLGVCPQHNVLFGRLSVREQLHFYAALKGVSRADIDREVEAILESVSLEDKADELSEKLSGGQKRRLSIGIALVGGSRFVILDEPTAGVDVNSRKEIWTLLMKHKEGRTILMSTHHMDEADVLSDRIAILSQGKLTALGSSVFLKNRFGRHSTITCIKDVYFTLWSTTISAIEEMREGMDVRVADESEEEISFHLPIQATSEELEAFFDVLEKEASSLGISDYAFSAPTLQEIFISLAPQSDLKLTKDDSPNVFARTWKKFRGDKSRSSDGWTDNEGYDQSVEDLTSNEKCVEAEQNGLPGFDGLPSLTTRPRPLRHIRALLTARWIAATRSLWTTLAMMVLPVLLLLACEVYAKMSSGVSESDGGVKGEDSIRLDANVYGNNTDTYISLWDRSNNSIGVSLASSLLGFPGMGTRCLDDSPLDPREYPCLSEGDIAQSSGNLTVEDMLKVLESDVSYNAEIRSCFTGERVDWQCSQSDYPMGNISSSHARTSDFLYDFSFRNLSQFRLVTQFLPQSSGNAYAFTGGLGLGHRSQRAPSAEKIETERKTCRIVWKTLKDIAPIVGLDLSNISVHSPDNGTFHEGVTLGSFLDRLLASMDTDDVVKIWFNNKRYASLPLLTNALSNAILRLEAEAEGANVSSLGIGVSNHPMVYSVGQSFDTSSLEKIALFRIVLLLLVLCIVPAGLGVSLVDERVSHSLHLQLLSGLSRPVYWATSFVFAFIIFLLSLLLISVVYLSLSVGDFAYSPSVFFSFFLALAIYGVVAILFVFVLQRLFSNGAVAFVVIAIGSFFVGVVMTMTVVMVETLMETYPDLLDVYLACGIVFMVIPQYNVGMAIARASMAFQAVAVGQGYLLEMHRPELRSSIPSPPLLEWQLMGKHLVALGIQAAIGLVLLALAESGRLQWRKGAEGRRTEKMMGGQADEEDEDVVAEKERVSAIGSEEGVVVAGLAKAYGSRLVVGGVSFAVGRGECFGLLGLNGAGKTTTFGMMTGAIDIGHGEVSILGERVSRHSSSAFSNLGYCPQFDALNMKLTTRENIEFYARIRGVEEGELERLGTSLLSSLHLLPYSGVRAGSLSGGNRRKLSVAVALISSPPVIMLDEPSAGMDPGSQQFLWEVLRGLRREGRTVVLTSHSMEECEALCTRMAIMDRGRVRCIGSKTHLKNKFGQGLSLTLKLMSVEDANKSREVMREVLPEATLLSIHCTAAKYRVPTGTASVAAVMKAVNEIKRRLPVEDFAVSQSTLEEIFQRLGQSPDTPSTLTKL